MNKKNHTAMIFVVFKVTNSILFWINDPQFEQKDPDKALDPTNTEKKKSI